MHADEQDRRAGKNLQAVQQNLYWRRGERGESNRPTGTGGKKKAMESCNVSLATSGVLPCGGRRHLDRKKKKEPSLDPLADGGKGGQGKTRP